VPPAGSSSCRALLVYEGAGRQLVTALKFRNQRACLAPLARAMAALVLQDSHVVATAEGVTWAPTSSERRRGRGFDQAEMLARAVAAACGLPCRGLLRRTSRGGQTGRPLVARLEGPRFVATRRPWSCLVLVDDVLTTGSTVSAAASALRAAGARDVHGLVAAHTPPPATATQRGRE